MKGKYITTVEGEHEQAITFHHLADNDVDAAHEIIATVFRQLSHVHAASEAAWAQAFVEARERSTRIVKARGGKA